MPFGGLCPLPLRLGGGPEDGWSPEQHARFSADLQAIKRVAPLASWRYTQTGAAAVAIHEYAGQNGHGLSYAPTPTGNGDGDVSFVWSGPYFSDDYNVQHPFKVRACIANASAQAASAVWQQIAGGVRIRVVTVGGVASNTVVHVTVW